MRLLWIVAAWGAFMLAGPVARAESSGPAAAPDAAPAPMPSMAATATAGATREAACRAVTRYPSPSRRSPASSRVSTPGDASSTCRVKAASAQEGGGPAS